MGLDKRMELDLIVERGRIGSNSGANTLIAKPGFPRIPGLLVGFARLCKNQPIYICQPARPSGVEIPLRPTSKTEGRLREKFSSEAILPYTAAARKGMDIEATAYRATAAGLGITQNVSMPKGTIRLRRGHPAIRSRDGWIAPQLNFTSPSMTSTNNKQKARTRRKCAETKRTLVRG